MGIPLLFTRSISDFKEFSLEPAHRIGAAIQFPQESSPKDWNSLLVLGIPGHQARTKRVGYIGPMLTLDGPAARDPIL